MSRTRARPRPPRRSSRARARAPTIPPSVLPPRLIITTISTSSSRRRSPSSPSYLSSSSKCNSCPSSRAQAATASWWVWAVWAWWVGIITVAWARWPGSGRCRGRCPPQTSLLWLPEQSHPCRRRYPPRQLHLHVRPPSPHIPTGTHCQLSHRRRSTLILTDTSSEPIDRVRLLGYRW